MISSSTRPDFRQIRNQVSILSAAAKLGVRVAPGNKIRCCDGHRHNNGDRNPSASIMTESGTFRCWVCPDIRGDVIDFVRLYGKMDWHEAVSFLQQLGASGGASVQPERLILQRDSGSLEEHHVEAMEALMSLASPIDLRCQAYLSGRGIDLGIAHDAGVRCLVSPNDVKAQLIEMLGREHPGLGAVFNKEGNLRFYIHRLLFPYWNEDGRIVFIQGRDITGKAAAKENAAHVPQTVPWIPIALDEIETAWMTEGVTDGLTLLTYGKPPVGLPGAGAWQAWWAELFYGKRVVLCLDGDLAGRQASRRIENDLVGIAKEVVDLNIPDGEDVNSLAKVQQLAPFLLLP